ncbi:MAG: cytochrome c peroxidase [Bryobacteraceae bacterium]
MATHRGACAKVNPRLLLFCGLIASSSASQDPATLTRPQATRRALDLAALGRKMFFDPSLSGSGRLSCSSCHDPKHAYGPPNAASVQAGGKDMRQLGFRAAPGLTYLQVIPPFTEHYFDSDGPDPSLDNGPTGGLAWDGRIDRGRDQARIPLLSPYEMANHSPAEVIASVRKAPYAAEFERVAGNSAAADAKAAFDTILEALETWEQDYREFYPYNSKYDAWLAGAAKLTDRELRGLQLFSDPAKGNCARCHIATRGANGTPPQFTDYGFVALGAPRNYRIPANSNPSWYDLGLCGPERTDLRTEEKHCGQFITPSLRNVATRGAFFHNGVFHTLKEVVEFYVQRDTNPEKWYPRNGEGVALKFDDLPPRYRNNVETGVPFGLAPGARPALNGEEIGAVVAFLKTLTDGYYSVK